MSEQNLDEHRLFDFLDKTISNSYATLEQEGQYLVHYTSADTAVKILQNRSVWFRNARFMNDREEIIRGQQLLKQYILTNSNALSEVIESLSQGLWNVFLDRFSKRERSWAYGTYLMSYSMFDEPDGKLSMWRGYGGKAPVALVIDSGALMQDAPLIPTTGLPVFYWKGDELVAFLDGTFDELKQKVDQFVGQPIEDLASDLINFFETLSVILKHPGFHEEREWRSVYPAHLTLPMYELKQEVVTLNGVPQPVFIMPLEDRSKEGFGDTSVESLLKKIVIGPSDHQYMVYEALSAALKPFNLPNKESLIEFSDIPFRA